jgi:hypothetical protein
MEYSVHNLINTHAEFFMVGNTKLNHHLQRLSLLAHFIPSHQAIFLVFLDYILLLVGNIKLCQSSIRLIIRSLIMVKLSL